MFPTTLNAFQNLFDGLNAAYRTAWQHEDSGFFGISDAVSAASSRFEEIAAGMFPTVYGRDPFTSLSDEYYYDNSDYYDDWYDEMRRLDEEEAAERAAKAAEEAEWTAILFPVAIAAKYLDHDFTDRYARGIRS
jgi:hypothetical protein